MARILVGLLLFVALLDPPCAEALQSSSPESQLAARGLKRVGDRYVLAEEDDLRRRLAALDTLVDQNLEAIHRRWLRSVASGGTLSLLADLQFSRYTLYALAVGNPVPIDPMLGLHQVPGANLGRAEALQYLYRSNNQQVDNLYLILAGSQIENQYQASMALGRLDQFTQGRDRARAVIADLDRRYRELNADLDVRAALGAIVRAENRPVTLGPRDDYAARLDAMTQAIDRSRVLSSARGKSAPDYAIAAGLYDGMKKEYRQALGRQAVGTSKLSAEERARLSYAVADYRTRYVRSVALLRRAYDAQDLKPGAADASKSAAPPGAGRIRDLVDRNNAIRRAAYVAEAEKSLQVDRIPATARDHALYVKGNVNGVPDVSFRVDVRADHLTIPASLAPRLNLPQTPGPSRLRSLRLGTFTLDDVACVVVAEAKEPVLGRSVLDGFVADVDDPMRPQALILTRVDLPPILPRPLPAPTSRAPGR